MNSKLSFEDRSITAKRTSSSPAPSFLEQLRIVSDKLPDTDSVLVEMLSNLSCIHSLSSILGHRQKELWLTDVQKSFPRLVHGRFSSGVHGLIARAIPGGCTMVFYEKDIERLSTSPHFLGERQLQDTEDYVQEHEGIRS